MDIKIQDYEASGKTKIKKILNENTCSIFLADNYNNH